MLFPRLASACCALLLFAGAGACAGSKGNELSVDVRTDYVAGIEFDAVWVRVDAQPWETRAARQTENFVRGQRVADIGGLGNGRQQVFVQLRLGETMVAERDVPVDISGDLAITVIFSRDCEGVTCAGELSACVGGRCVNPECTPETPESCPADACTSDSACPSTSPSCLRPTCSVGVCLYADDGTCGAGQYCDPTMGCRPRPTDMDMGPPDLGPDSGPPDLGVDFGQDFGPGCAGVFCEAFEYCSSTLTCEPYPGCLTSDECLDGAICRNRRCIPPTADPDGDGTTADTDCDESNPDRYPGNVESCDDVDEDCDDTVDEGNPGILCENAMQAGECQAGGVCGCPTDRYDLDGVRDNGCECAAMPAGGMNESCASAIDLGNVRDDGSTVTSSGNALPAGREVWYRVRAVDVAETTCETLSLAVELAPNPGDAYRLSVHRGSCSAAEECPGDYTEYGWYADVRQTIGGRLTGHCPCTTGANQADVSRCSDLSSDYFIRVTRRTDVAETCAPYTLTVSNGL